MLARAGLSLKLGARQEQPTHGDTLLNRTALVPLHPGATLAAITDFAPIA